MEKNVLGDYAIIKQIGRGTLGSVHLAEHRFLKKRFALKVLPEELASDRHFIRRFEKEIEQLASFTHPHIVKVYNVSFAEGYYFLVTDCIVDRIGETTNLMHYLGTGKQLLNENETLELLSQIASALDYIHRKPGNDLPIAHLGVKPNNILIGRGEGGLHVHLSDCGLSRIVGEGAVLTMMYKTVASSLAIDFPNDSYPPGVIDSSKLSKLHASFLQTYAFLAPEQKIYREQPVGKEADIYAFGILAYFLLTHSFPEGAFPPPSEIHPDFRLPWDDLITRCLNPDPTRRPDSLPHLLEELIRPRGVRGDVSESDIREKKVYCVTSEGGEDAPPAPSSVAVETATEPSPSEDAPPEPLPGSQRMLKELSNALRAKSPKPVLTRGEIKKPEYDPDPGSIFRGETAVARYTPDRDEEKEVLPLLSDMVVIRGGEFYRGSNRGGRDERPRHKIRINSFALDIHPVTNEQFVRFLEVMGGEKDVNNQDIIQLKESRIKRHGGKLTIESGYAEHPVIGVTWYGAVAYAKWVGKRLPTEAEWEIAALGGREEMIYPTGKTIERSRANFFNSDTVKVKSYPANPYGLYDMAGNVYEWCRDWYGYNYYELSKQEPENPQGPLQGVYRVLRGGCWKSLKEDLRCAHRHRNNPGLVTGTYGFRCAADVDE